MEAAIKKYRNEFMTALAILLLNAWIGYFHHCARMNSAYLPYSNEFPLWGYISCLVQSSGIALGILVSHKVGLARIDNGTTISKMYLGGVCLTLMQIATCIFASDALAMLFIQILAVSLGSALTIVFVNRGKSNKPTLLIYLMAWFLGQNVLECCFPSISPNSTSLCFDPIAPGIALMLSWLLQKKTTRQDAVKPTQDHRTIDIPAKAIAHISLYGMAFGIFHVTLGLYFEGTIPYEGATAMGSIIASAFARQAFKDRNWTPSLLWQCTRGIVMPFAVIGFGLFLLSTMSVFSIALTESVSVLYGIVLVLGCHTASQECEIDFSRLLSGAVLCKSLGFLAGSIVGMVIAYLVFFGYVDFATPFLFTIALFFVGTLWVGDDEELRRWWGLRIKKSPKQYSEEKKKGKLAELGKKHGLTNRELEIALLLAEGMRVNEIAEELCISVATVRNHTNRIYRKLDVHSVKDLKRIANESTHV